MSTWRQALHRDSSLVMDKWVGDRLVGVDGTPLNIVGVGRTKLHLTGIPTPLDASMLAVEAILGLDFLERHKCAIGCEHRTIQFPKQGKLLMLSSSQEAGSKHSPTQIGLVLTQKLVLPALSESEIMASLLEKTVEDGRSWIVSREPSDRMGVLVAHALVCPANNAVPLRVLNPREEPVIVPKGTRIATLEALEREPQMMSSKYMQCQQQVTRVFHQVKRECSGSWCQRLEVKKLLEDMLKKDVIRPSNSPWLSPIILVQKKDGSTRFCIDYRKVNAVTRKDAYPMPRVDDTLDTHGGSKFFSTLDLANGYWQVDVEEKDTQKTAFNTPEGLYEFRVMPFGLCNATATFQRLMERVLGDMKWTDCLVYVHDIIVAEASRSQTPTSKMQVFSAAGCFLGHVVSPGGVSTDPSKTDVVAEWPIPTNKKEVQQFLSLANYYKRFIKNFASIAKPLQRLTEKNLNFFEWTDTCQDAFNHLRKCLVTAPIIAFPDFSKKFILDTDASDCGIGAVLAQVQDDGILRAVEINHKPHQDQLKSWSRESRRLMQFWETLLVKDGTLWRLPTTDGQQFQLVVPFIL
ncbi:hypothetical protein EMCRGX_G006900 [Ephydatia muelleri]